MVVLYPGYAGEADYVGITQRLGEAATIEVVHTPIDQDAHTVESLRAMGAPDLLKEQAGALYPRPQAVVWGSTSASFVFGWDGAHEQVRIIGQAAQAPSTTTALAFVRAAEELGVRRVSIAATYPPDITDRFVEFLGRGGLDVIAAESANIFLAEEAGRVEPVEVRRMVVASDRPDAEAVLVPDTALRTVEVVDEVEHQLGKLVLTANVVTAWAGLRLAGMQGRAVGLGALFDRA